MTGGFVGEKMVSGPSAVLAHLALSGGSGRSAASVAPHRPDVPHKPYALHKLFVPGRLEAPQMPFSLCNFDVFHIFFAPRRLGTVQMLFSLGRAAAPDIFVALQSLSVPHMPFAPHTPVSLSAVSPGRLVVPGMPAALGTIVLHRPSAPRKLAFLYMLVAFHMLVSLGRPVALGMLSAPVRWLGSAVPLLWAALYVRSGV